MKYDYIICGGGMSGLSLAYYIVESSLNGKTVLVIEPSDKDKNDRTWAFWEKGQGTFESIVYRKWDSVDFVTTENKTNRLDIGDYSYKVIRGIDFYGFTQQALRTSGHVTFLKEHVHTIHDAGTHVTVHTREGSTIHGSFAFDSTFKLNLAAAENYNLLQHFKGIVLKTAIDAFNPSVPVMMDFSVQQKNDECRFIYILPFEARTALVEYTLFSESLLTQDAYDQELRQYIQDELKLTEYEILEEEFGVIPMSDVPTEEFPSARVVRIGTAGGYTNPSTGYTFQNTQARLQDIVQQLVKTGSPVVQVSWWQKRHLLYASVLLNVLQKKRVPVAHVFQELYDKNPPERVFRFLDGTTSFTDELKIMSTTPIKHFLAASAEVIQREIKRALN